MKNLSHALPLEKHHETIEHRPNKIVELWNNVVLPTLAKINQWFLTRSIRSHEPQIKLVFDHQGHELWKVYDPITGRQFRFMSEQEVRVWLDQRYYF
ncbi:hypothetical protein [Spirulina subsalsa]|uniref:hypothetical protein n=1 Tax=Spirulina subsalsa TaxID=54311 RepID=UPI000316F2B0|nr:hypothetical protein [Spirulina subsalsa]